MSIKSKTLSDYEQFIVEHKKLFKNTQEAFEIAHRLKTDMREQISNKNDNNKEESLIEYGMAKNELRNMTNILREFNIKFSVFSSLRKSNDLNRSSGNHEILSENDQTSDENLNSSTAEWNNGNKKCAFKSFDVSKFTVGYEGRCVLTHVLDKEKFFFYINETENLEYKQLTLKMFDYLEKTGNEFLKQLPEFGEIFGVLLDNFLLRAIRDSPKDNVNRKKGDIFLLLIDIGEKIVFNETMKIYSLPEEFQNLPSQAILCQLSTESNFDDNKKNTMLTEGIYATHVFIVTRNEGYYLIVDLLPDNNPFRKDSVGNSNSIEEVKTFSSEKNFESATNHKSEDVNDFNEKTIQSKVINVENCPSAMSSNECYSKVTDEERSILYEEPLNTTNAMVATMGYDPKDDKRICKFYDEKTGGCFKGARCRLQHVPKMKDGWTKDTALSVHKVPNQIECPAVDSKITVNVTHIIDATKFYAHIEQNFDRYRPTLTEMAHEMNLPEVSVKFRKFNRTPEPFELIIAKYRSDGFWYRGKIINVIEEEPIAPIQFLVFYVDYGNSDILLLEDLRVWDHKYDYLAFQAVCCELADIEPKPTRKADSVVALSQTILNKKLTAIVKSNFENLCLKLHDTNGYDVGDMLIARGFANSMESLKSSIKNGQHPG